MSLRAQSGQMPPAVVISLDGVNGLQTARTLARRGIPVLGIATDRDAPGCRTRVCEEIIFAETRGDGVIAALEALGPRLGSRAVLFPCEDLNVLPVSRHRQRLERWYHIVLPEPDVVEMLMHKASLCEFAEDHGLPIPRTFMLANRSDAEQAARQLVFPCIIKPSPRSRMWEARSRAKVHRASTAGEFLALYDECASWTERLIVQEWVEGPDSSLYTCYGYFGADAEPLVTFVTRKLRQWPAEMGEGCLGEECQNEAVLNETVRFFQSAGMRGFGYLEMKRDARTGQYLIVEPNIGRYTSKSSLAEASGVEMVYTMYCDALGWPLPRERMQKYRGAKWVFLRRDCQSAVHYWRKGELTLVEWLRSLRGVKVDAMFSWSDPAPFWRDVTSAGRRHLSRKTTH
jgi:predicted ATP-grasp superfamily ATP-dependent carboligase